MGVVPVDIPVAGLGREVDFKAAAVLTLDIAVTEVRPSFFTTQHLYTCVGVVDDFSIVSYLDDVVTVQPEVGAKGVRAIRCSRREFIDNLHRATPDEIHFPVPACRWFPVDKHRRHGAVLRNTAHGVTGRADGKVRNHNGVTADYKFDVFLYYLLLSRHLNEHVTLRVEVPTGGGSLESADSSEGLLG